MVRLIVIFIFVKDYLEDKRPGISLSSIDYTSVLKEMSTITLTGNNAQMKITIRLNSTAVCLNLSRQS